MGILNCTPDSFYDGGNFYDKPIDQIVSRYQKCDIIDIGFESSRPGANKLSLKDELNRLDKFLPYIKKFNDKVLSIDSYKPEVVKHALKNGFNIINDIYGGKNCKLFEISSEFNAPIIIMHMKGNPINMQYDVYYDNIIDDIKAFLEKQVIIAREYGINNNNIIIDPGIGFGKSFEDNYKILHNIDEFKGVGYKLLIGHSRKSFLNYKDDNPNQRLISTIAISSYLIYKKVDIVRVHDVKETFIARDILSRIDTNNGN